MTTIEKLRTLARELAGEAWDHQRRQLAAQAYVRREAANVLMTQAGLIQSEDAMFGDPEAEFDRSYRLGPVPTRAHGGKTHPGSRDHEG